MLACACVCICMCAYELHLAVRGHVSVAYRALQHFVNEVVVGCS